MIAHRATTDLYRDDTTGMNQLEVRMAKLPPPRPALRTHTK